MKLQQYILLIETTTAMCSVGIARNGEIWIVREQAGKPNHAAQLTLFIEEVLQMADMPLSDIDAVAVSKGPGSYTGLRIGVSTAKGICYALDKPLLGISTLQLLANSVVLDEPLQAEDRIVALLDARRADAYAAVFDSNNETVLPPHFITINEEELGRWGNSGRIFLVGDAVEKSKELLTNQNDLIFTSIKYPSVKYMASLAQQAWEEKNYEDVAYFEPFYLKQPNITKPKSPWLITKK